MGFMGTGKTTLGRALALDMGMSFCDLDQYIEQRYMRSVSRIFSELGQDEFRKIEARLLREVGEFEDIVISCGGSTPLYYGNMEYMKAQGKSVWLDTPVPVLFRRLRVASATRPLIAGKNDEQLMQFITEELERRNVSYSEAEYRYSGERLESVEQVAESVQGVRNLLNL